MAHINPSQVVPLLYQIKYTGQADTITLFCETFQGVMTLMIVEQCSPALRSQTNDISCHMPLDLAD